MLLLLQIATVLVLDRAMRWLFVPLGQPALIGEMVAMTAFPVLARILTAIGWSTRSSVASPLPVPRSTT